eukprot:IDg19698t1
MKRAQSQQTTLSVERYFSTQIFALGSAESRSLRVRLHEMQQPLRAASGRMSASSQKAHAVCQKGFMTSFKNRVNDPRLFCSMDETAVYFDCKMTRTVQTNVGKLSSFALVDRVRTAAPSQGLDRQARNANMVQEDLRAVRSLEGLSVLLLDNPCDVGMNKPIKTRLQRFAKEWLVEKYTGDYRGELGSSLLGDRRSLISRRLHGMISFLKF